MSEPITASLLLPNEHALWSGGPGGGVIFQPMDIFLVPFSVVWCSVASFGAFAGFGGVRDSAASPFDLFGLLFVVIGFYFVFGRFLVDIMLRRSLRYTLTTRRILIERGGLWSKSTVVSLVDAPPISLRRMRGGRGTIRIGESNLWMGRGSFGAWSPTMDPTPQLIAIDDAQRVFDLVQRTQDKLLHGQS